MRKYEQKQDKILSMTLKEHKHVPVMIMLLCN